MVKRFLKIFDITIMERVHAFDALSITQPIFRDNPKWHHEAWEFLLEISIWFPTALQSIRDEGFWC